ncbi:MAG TPA: ABC-2 transporter permease [Acidobacteriaceae bacterium]|nr:ABC-2 transporter permease [Acidobacteriaceae bacterium]
MKGRVTQRLILKDWQLNRPMIALSILGGLLALGVLLIGGQTPFVLGAAFFFVSMIFCASLLPMSNILNERKKQTLAFMMSLPISAAQYGTAKLVSTLGMFLIPWLTLIAAALYVILWRHVLPNGVIPTALILAVLPLLGFCLITGTALVSESERWGTAAMAVVNSSYWIAWYLLVSQFPSLTRTWTSPVAVWNAVEVEILVTEFAVIVIALGLTVVLQSRKRDFV